MRSALALGLMLCACDFAPPELLTGYAKDGGPVFDARVDTNPGNPPPVFDAPSDDMAMPPDAVPSVDAAVPCGPSGYFLGPTGCYRAVTTAVSWPTAETDCENDGSGTHLVVIGTTEENTWINLLLPGDAWIGYTDRVTEDEFQWVVGGAGAYLFGGGEPNDGGFTTTEDCVHKRADGLWNDHECTGGDPRPFICEFDMLAPNPDFY